MQTQEVEQSHQRQAEDGEIVALDAGEQLHALVLELVAADRTEDVLAPRRQIAVDERVAVVSHGQSGAGDLAPDRLAVAGHDHGRVQLVALAAQQLQTLARLDHALGLVEQGAVEIEGLVGADDEVARSVARDPDRLQLRQRVGDIARTIALGQQGGLDRTLVDAGDGGFERHARAGQDRGAGSALGGENNHPSTSTWPRPPDSRLMIAAEVSSTELRVTSITGQPWRSNSRRAAMISSRTDSWSM